MSNTPKTDKEAMWADSGTGEEFQCVHIDDVREMELILREARQVLDDWCEEYGHLDLEKMRDKIDRFFSSIS